MVVRVLCKLRATLGYLSSCVCGYTVQSWLHRLTDVILDCLALWKPGPTAEQTKDIALA